MDREKNNFETVKCIATGLFYCLQESRSFCSAGLEQPACVLPLGPQGPSTHLHVPRCYTRQARSQADPQAAASQPAWHQSQENPFPAEPKPLEARFHPEALPVGVGQRRALGHCLLTPPCRSSPGPLSHRSHTS